MTAPYEPGLPVAGWYPDPAGRAELRWWDGTVWTTSVVDGQVARTDLHGLPIASAPGQPAAPLTTFELPPASPAPGRPSRGWVVPAAAVAFIAALVIALVAIVRQGDDRAEKDETARSELSRQLDRLGDDVSDLSSHVDELSSQSSSLDLPELSDFSSSLSELGRTIDPCDVVLPEDVQAALGIAVHVDRDYGFGFLCLLTTDDRVGGTAISVRADEIYGDLLDQFGEVPGGIQPRPVVAGDEAYVATAYGSVMGVVAKGNRFAQIQIETAGDAPTDEQVTALLVAAAGRL